MLVRHLDNVSSPVAAAAAQVIKAICVQNEGNKAAIRKAWALALLVKLLGPQVSPCKLFASAVCTIECTTQLSAIVELFCADCMLLSEASGMNICYNHAC